MEKAFTRQKRHTAGLLCIIVTCSLFPLDFPPTPKIDLLLWSLAALRLRFVIFLGILVAPGYLDGWTGWLWAPLLLS